MGKSELTDELNRIEEVKRRSDDLLTKLSSINNYDDYILNAYHSLEADGASNAVSYESCGEIVNHFKSAIRNQEDKYTDIEAKMKDARNRIKLRFERLSDRESEIREELDRIEAEEAMLRKKYYLPVDELKS